jgi:hypothetical protein
MWNGEECVASLGTEVTIKGYYFADGSKTKVNVVVTINGENYLVVKDHDTDATGYFEASFIFPTAPSGKYTITVSDTSEHEKDATADFTVIPGLIITKPVVTGPSVLEIVATGFPVDESAVLLIDGTDALFGTNKQMEHWQFNEYGVLVSSMGTIFKPGFVLPVLEAGEYEITLKSLGSEYYASSYVYVQNDIADLGTIIGEIISIKDGIAIIQTDLGEVKVSLEELDAKVVDVIDGIATIETDLGTIEASLTDLNAKVVAIDGKLVTIQTDLGTIKADVSKQSSLTADIASGDAPVTIDSTPTWIAAIMAVIAAVSAIGCLVILVRKLA